MALAPDSMWTIYLPWSPAGLPMAQRLAAWATRAGQGVRLEMVDDLPAATPQSMALGHFARSAHWQRAGGIALDPLDWPALAAWAQAHWPVARWPRSLFAHAATAATRVLPGEYWGDGETGLDIRMAPPEWALQQATAGTGLQLATAESCTAGGVAARLAALPGSSALLRQGFVVYANAAKTDLLGVSPDTLSGHGAVSEPVVAEMLAGALRHADLAVAISGIAGPGGAVPGKPVGTVCLGWAQRGGATQIQTQHFSGDRWAIQYAAGSVVLGGLLDLLQTVV